MLFYIKIDGSASYRWNKLGGTYTKQSLKTESEMYLLNVFTTYRRCQKIVHTFLKRKKLY